jgi:Kdo2-lipid IVA lauroyltransferase/acyltransferase
MFIYKIIHYLEELLYRLVIVPLVAFLPAPLAYGLACARGDGRYLYDKLARERIMHNLEAVLGDQLSPNERAGVTRDFFRRRSCEAMDMMRLAGSSRALARLVEIRGLEHVEAALAAGKGAIICCAHFGFFYSGFCLIGAHGFPITVVGNWRSTYDPTMSRLKRFVWQLIYEKPLTCHQRRPAIEPQRELFGTASLMAEVLCSNELIAIPVDPPTLAAERSRAVPLDFLGRQCLLLPGTIMLAQLTGSPVLTMILQRSADWRHQILEISPPVPLDGDAIEAFKRCMVMLEAPIRRNLAYWSYWEDTQSLIDFGLLSTQEQL